jgi:anti-sigma regulatory factor (Ser/Thr protein kinase)
MSLVFPAFRAEASTRRGLNRAFFWFASVLLGASFVATVAFAVRTPDYQLWLVLPALTVMWIAVLVIANNRQWWLVVGGIALLVLAQFFYARTIADFLFVGSSSATFFLSTTKMALTIAGAMADRWSSGSLGAVLGYVAAEGAVQLGILGSQRTVAIDYAAIGLAVSAAVALELLVLSRKISRRIEPTMAASDDSERAAIERQVLQLRSTALIHDTILNELATLATTVPGPLPEVVLKQIGVSLDLAEQHDLPGTRQDAEVAGALLAVVSRQRDAGLAIEVTGDLAAMERLGAERAEALARAVEQCLVNVRQHAGTSAAELVFGVDERELTVMVTDDGVGFDEASVAPARMGLRASVRGRITGVGGAVQVWSSPGNGTSIVLSLPLAQEDA